MNIQNNFQDNATIILIILITNKIQLSLRYDNHKL